MSALMGEHRHLSRDMLLRKKSRGRNPDPAFWGMLLEDGVARGLAALNMWDIEKTDDRFYISDKYQGMGASVDYIINQTDGTSVPLEIKTTSDDEFAKWGENPPLQYIMQVQQQIECMGTDCGYLGVLVMGSRKSKVYKIERDQTMIDNMGAEIEKFMHTDVRQNGRQRYA